MGDLVKLARSDAAALFSRDLIRNGSDEASELRQSPEYRAAKTLEQTAARIEALERQVKAADALADALEAYENAAVDHMDFQSDLEAALAAYKAAKEGGA